MVATHGTGDLSMNHCFVKFYSYTFTLILSLSKVLRIFLHGTDHRHSVSVAHIVVIKHVFFCRKYYVMSSGYCINHYKFFSTLRVLHDTIILLCVAQK